MSARGLTITNLRYSNLVSTSGLNIRIQQRLIRENMVWDDMDPDIRDASIKLIDRCREIIVNEEIKILRATAEYIRSISVFVNQ